MGGLGWKGWDCFDTILFLILAFFVVDIIFLNVTSFSSLFC